MDSLNKAIEAFLELHGNQRTYWIAYSGGLDSHVLLHLLAKLRAQFSLTLHAVYVNHGVNSRAAQWGRHCLAQCNALQIPFTQVALQLPSHADENTMRQHRYQEFNKLLQADDILLTAHHQNDQAETVLLQLLRGGGPKGLAGMPQIKPFSSGFHARPLLHFTRDQLEQYATQQQLTWMEDSSNLDTDITRNFLRHDILPLLQSRWPTVTETLGRVAVHCAETQTVLETLTEDYLQNALGSEPNQLSVKKLTALSIPLQRQVLRLWFKQQQVPLPSTVKMQHILQDMLQARADKMPMVAWQQVELRRYRDDLILRTCLPEHNHAEVVAWDFLSVLDLKELGTLTAEKVQGAGLRADISHVTVRFRQGGETIRLPGRHCQHDLKKLWQQQGVPPWLRNRIPLLYVGEQLVAVVGYWIASDFLAEPKAPGWQVFQLQQSPNFATFLETIDR